MRVLLFAFKYCIITSVETVLSKWHPPSLQSGVLDSASLKSWVLPEESSAVKRFPRLSHSAVVPLGAHCISGVFVSLAGVDEKKKKKKEMETPLVHACALSAGIVFLATLFPLRTKLEKKTKPKPYKHKHAQANYTKRKKKKKAEDQEWQTNNSSQFSLVQCRQNHRALYKPQVEPAPPTCFPS